MDFAATVVRDEMGMILHKTGPEVLGSATKIVITKDSTLIVTDGSTREAVDKRVYQIQRLVEVQLTSGILVHNLSRVEVIVHNVTVLSYVYNYTCTHVVILVFQNTKEEFQKKILNERIGRLSGGIAILQVFRLCTWHLYKLNVKRLTSFEADAIWFIDQIIGRCTNTS